MKRKTGLRAGHILITLLALALVSWAGLTVASPSRMAQGTTKAHTGAGTFDSTTEGKVGRSGPSSPLFGPNVRANQDNTQNGQHEPSLAVSRVHTNTVIVASKDYREGNIKRVWIDGSTDGGVTWPIQVHMPNLPATVNESDPVVMARDDGRIYVSCLTTGNEGIFITWTDDDGQTWQPSVPIVQNQPTLQDKDWFAIDNNPTSPYYHRMYMMWAPGATSVVESHSTDGGLTWSAKHSISGSDTEYTYPVVGSDGTVYNFMMQGWNFGSVGTIQMTKSTNGGVTWSAPATVTMADQPFSPIRSGDTYRFFAILSAAVDPNNNNLYVAWTDNRNFDTNGTDVVYVRSTNGGATWSAVTRLSHDTPAVGRDHITPMLAVGADSTLHAFWLDRRVDPPGRDIGNDNPLYNSWYSSSTDGGVTWADDTKVSSVAQNMNCCFPTGSNNAAGDYWGLDVSQDTVYVAWNDTRGGDQDIMVSKGLMSSGGGGTPTPTSTVPATATSTPAITNTPMPTVSGTASSTPTSQATGTANPSTTATSGATGTPVVTATSGSTATGTPSSTPGPNCQSFTDVPQDNVFYPQVYLLSCQGLISGYPCGGPNEPCDNQQRPYFRINNNITRGQIAKIVAGAAGFTEPVSGQSFEDVPVGSTFYQYIERLAARNVMSGYPCGAPNEPCGAGNLPYFRPGNNATRGQISKIVSNAAGFTEPAGNRIFEDVTPGSTFYDYIQRLASRNVMQGYPCGSPGEPCGNGNLPYFRPNSNASRGQTSKIIANTFFP
ncbi:MAG: S-layer homology domain-containing protein [Chloroflexota bacterium]